MSLSCLWHRGSSTAAWQPPSWPRRSRAPGPGAWRLSWTRLVHCQAAPLGMHMLMVAHVFGYMWHRVAQEQQQQLQGLRSLADQLERSRLQALQQVQEGHGALQAAVSRAAELERLNREGAAALAARDADARAALTAVQVCCGIGARSKERTPMHTPCARVWPVSWNKGGMRCCRWGCSPTKRFGRPWGGTWATGTTAPRLRNGLRAWPTCSWAACGYETLVLIECLHVRLFIVCIVSIVSHICVHTNDCCSRRRWMPATPPGWRRHQRSVRQTDSSRRPVSCGRSLRSASSASRAACRNSGLPLRRMTQCPSSCTRSGGCKGCTGILLHNGNEWGPLAYRAHNAIIGWWAAESEGGARGSPDGAGRHPGAGTHAPACSGNGHAAAHDGTPCTAGGACTVNMLMYYAACVRCAVACTSVPQGPVGPAGRDPMSDWRPRGLRGRLCGRCGARRGAGAAATSGTMLGLIVFV